MKMNTNKYKRGKRLYEGWVFLREAWRINDRNKQHLMRPHNKLETCPLKQILKSH